MLTTRFATIELVIILFAFMSGAWGPRPCPTELHRGVYVTTDEPRASDEQKAPEICDYSKITIAQAKQLHGQRIKVKARIRAVGIIIGGGTIYECSGNDDAMRHVVFSDKDAPDDKQAAGELLIEGTFAYNVIEPYVFYDGKKIDYLLVTALHDTKVVKR
jgi:hypothetical protein